MSDSAISPASEKRLFNQSMIGYLLKGRFRLAQGHQPLAHHQIPADFSGICVASMPDAACDDQVIDYLQQLAVRQVRLDFTYSALENHCARFLQRLLDKGFKVMLRLMPSMEDAARMDQPEPQQRWGDFVEAVLLRFGRHLESVEVGNTVNRRRWSGYASLDQFMCAWRIAHSKLRAHGVTIAGPNVSDFEPPFNAGFLAVMQQAGVLPDIHTDNLFSERSIEPELFDHRVLGRRLATWPKLNLIKKARLLGKLSGEYGVAKTYSTTAFWTLPRIARRLVDAEVKQADYVTRYMILTAVSSGLERAYWGPLISQREGLVDDGTGKPAAHELVTRYDCNNGCPADFRRRPAFFALAAFNQRIPGSAYLGQQGSSENLQVHAFRRPDGELVQVVWTTNAKAAVLARLYSEQELATARCHDLYGQPVAEIPDLVTESPLYLSWPPGTDVYPDEQQDVLPDLCVYGNRPGGQHYHFDDGQWRGLVFARDRAEADKILSALHPAHIEQPSKTAMLRKARNVIWRVADPRENASDWLVVKKPNRLSLNKRVTDRLKPSKAARSWNGAYQILRTGLGSPKPVAYFERSDRKDPLNNWYICEYAGEVPSVKQFFSAYARGETHCHGISRDDFFRQLQHFLMRLHTLGVYFRDLTGGNILVHMDDPANIHFSLIDTARARFYPHWTPMAARLSDLKRTCYKLDWEGRIAFMEGYLSVLGRNFGFFYRLPFHYFDWKMNVKRLLKGKSIRRVAVAPGKGN
ncbi:lipopolysaccharide kinase InaA family protein [Halopseudomonas salegens]|uniref:Lipopolysaccharide kinase (Kdo/WaaP) family protein n=1 Tax=Halopseudomonas salegens TaxID=1434072 RepID=A0A1H2GEH5_9GAMM|nr:lipopolysaccharide kinase InaA family protein [Halopseudomonas salegens]SDU18136.1 Lipopolysaccharide kinase (Kdo/WaaP) family protein [Halopseudomonas salegens]